MSRCNYDTLSSKHCSDVGVMSKGLSDEAIVTVKLHAYDDDGDASEDKT